MAYLRLLLLIKKTIKEKKRKEEDKGVELVLNLYIVV